MKSKKSANDAAKSSSLAKVPLATVVSDAQNMPIRISEERNMFGSKMSCQNEKVK